MDMIRQIKLSVILFAALVVACFLPPFTPVSAQTASGSKDVAPSNPDALALLTEVFDLYRHATVYRLEYVEETTYTGEFSRSWQKSLTTAIVGPSNRFRFEVRDHSVA